MPENFSQQTGTIFDNNYQVLLFRMKREGVLMIAMLRIWMWSLLNGMGMGLV